MNWKLKKLDELILKGFTGPFLVTFFLVLFAFTLQFYWLYMDELIGKGLGVSLTLQLMLYMAATLVPVALPLGILLAAIMTFGSFGENFELVAIKSSGISLFRFMRPLIVAVAVLSIAAFFFNNYVIPVATLKSYSLLYDMRNQRPTMNIKEGIFNNEIDNFSIRVGKKDEDGKRIYDIIIYDHSSGKKNNNVLIAKEGKMYASDNGKGLVFELKDGWRYEENAAEDGQEQVRMHFDKWFKVFDLSGFSFTRTKEELFKGNEEMMTVNQLGNNIDKIKERKQTAIDDVQRYVNPYFSFAEQKKEDSILKEQLKTDVPKPVISYDSAFVSHVPKEQRNKVTASVENNLNSMKRLISISASDMDLQNIKMQSSKILWHEKFTLSFACILLFLIGAPLGAIIRKGGLGMPVVIAVCFFVIYFIISSTGKKLAQQGVVSPWYGMWIATLILLPIAVVIMVSARNDSPIFNKEWYYRWGQRIRKIFKKTPSI